VHLEFFDSIEGIAAAKAELVHGLVGDRRAYLNADDPRVRAMAGGFAGRVVTWGTGADAGFRIVRIGNRGLEGTSFTIAHDGREVDFTSPVPGRHNVSNAAAAIAVGVTHEVGWDQAQDAVRRFSSALRRGVVRRYEGGFVVIDDSYNSNPAALAEMIAFVASLEGFRRRILVAGEMLELGADSSGLHSECGRVAAEAAFEPIIGVSGAARELLEGARRAGAADAGLVFADTAGEAGQVLAELVRDGDVILIKGSRGVHLEEVSEVLGRSFPEAKG
jgi:UDP-N-acetylmuramoyl-tripeptide--D-alanyl-D-alanine ligase